MADPLLGWIAPEDRTQEQMDAHQAALAMMPNFSLPFQELPKGTKIILSDMWKHPDVIADIGFEFTGFLQNTGSCVGVSDGNVTFTVAAGQRLLAVDPTQAFVPFWPFNYGRTRYLEGDRGRGEGAVDSVMGTQNTKEGYIDSKTPGLPAFNHSDGLSLPASTEMAWSDGGSNLVTQHLTLAKPHTMGTRSPLYSTQDIIASLSNLRPVLDGCNNYVGTGHIKNEGQDSYVVGRYDGRGGHSTGFYGVWNHPNDGYLFLYGNQWPADTYPKDPAGGNRCMVWLPQSEVDKLWTTGGGNGETMSLSGLNWDAVKIQRLLDWMNA